MRGKAVFYPMGWDDNGLPTERRVQNYFGVRCDPSLPYDAGVRAAGQTRKAADSGLAAELHRAVHQADRRGREGLRGSVADARPLGGLDADLRDDRSPGPARVAARVPPPAAPRPRVSGRGPDAVGRGLPHRGRAGGARGPRAAGRVSSHPLRPARRRLRRDRHDASGAHSGVRRAGGTSRRRALPAALRDRGRHADLRCPRTGQGASRSPIRRRARASR